MPRPRRFGDVTIMNTPKFVYKEAAYIWGGADPTDKHAVDRFFVETFHTLSKKKKGEVLAYLQKGKTRKTSIL